MLVASAVMVHAFVTGDYSIKYVQRYSDAAQPLFYKLASYWGGLDGSIMFWVTLLALFGSVAVYVNRERHRLLMPWVVAVICRRGDVLPLPDGDPQQPVRDVPDGRSRQAGQGLNPLLQNFYMAIHPPMLYLGFVGMTIPFAFGIAALATGQLDDSWLRAVRRWTMTAWLFLTVGLSLGGLWAYEELGWGGYWGWDPVENAGAAAVVHGDRVPALGDGAGTALDAEDLERLARHRDVLPDDLRHVHDAVGRRAVGARVRRGSRAGADVHGLHDRALVTVSFGLVIYRLPLLRSRNELDSWASREAAFLANNWILLFSAFFVLFATMFPTLSEAVRGERLTVGPPFFNKWMTPVGLILLFLTGVGPLLAWRKSTIVTLRNQFLWPASAAVVVAAGVTWLGIPFWASGLCFALCAFVATTITQEFVRGASVRQRTTGTDLFTALVGLFARSRRRYAGYIVHVGIVLMFLGFAGDGFPVEGEAPLTPGEQIDVGRYTVKFIGLERDRRRAEADGHGAARAVRRTASPLDRMYPARWFFRGREDDPTTEVALRRGLAEDLYIILGGYEVDKQTAVLQVKVNPLVNWIWFGVGVLVVRHDHRALAGARAGVRDEPGAGGRGDDVAGAVVDPRRLRGTRPRAAHRAGADGGRRAEESAREGSAQRDHLHVRDLRPQARRRVHLLAGRRRCARRSRVWWRAARTHDQIIEFYVDKYGSQEVLAAPHRQGLQPPRLVLPVRRRPARHRLCRRPRRALVAPLAPAPARRPRRTPRARTRMPSNANSTTSSGTSTNAGQFFLLLSMVGAIAAVAFARDTHPVALLLLSSGRPRRRPGRRWRCIARSPGSSARPVRRGR